MTKILHIITRLDMGGSAQNTLAGCIHLGRKYEMVLVCGLSRESHMTDSERQMVAKGIREAQRNGVRIITLASLVRRINPLYDLRALYSLVRLVQQEKPAVVHTHTSKAGILGRLAAKLARVPRIVHTPHGHVFYGHFGSGLSRIFISLERLFTSFTNRLIALTEGEKNDYLRLAVCSREKIFKIHSGVDINKFQSTQFDAAPKKYALGLSHKGWIIGFIGWLLPIKGPLVLLKAMDAIWQVHPDVQLVFIGKGDLEVELRSAAHKSNANGRVKFLGWRDDVHEIMPVFDIFVLPSLNEGMGRVLVEAMAAGKPVVASRVGGIQDLVRHHDNGLLVTAGDSKALAESINLLIDDPQRASLMGQRGRELCRQFSVESMVAKIDRLYENLI